MRLPKRYREAGAWTSHTTMLRWLSIVTFAERTNEARLDDLSQREPYTCLVQLALMNSGNMNSNVFKL